MIKPTITRNKDDGPHKPTVVTWEFDGENQGGAFDRELYGETVAQIGPADMSGEVSLEGSNDGETWILLQDVTGGFASVSGPALIPIDFCKYVRPVAKGAAVKATVTIIARR